MNKHEQLKKWLKLQGNKLSVRIDSNFVSTLLKEYDDVLKQAQSTKHQKIIIKKELPIKSQDIDGGSF